MNPKDLFLAALEKPALDRAVFLAGIDPALRPRVEALLAAHDASGEHLGVAPDRADTQSLAAGAAIGPDETQTHEEHGFRQGTTPAAGAKQRLGPYELLEVLGQGGFGTVYRAFDHKLHRVVALKTLASELAAQGTARQRFLREARAAAAVRHEHVIGIHAVDEEPLPHLVMEFISGQNLQQKLDRQGPLTLKETLRIGSQIAAGLAAAHAQGLIHRDIKPSNILLENGIERVKISDFGLARAVDDSSISQSGIIAGTPMYMSPEQAEGKPLDHRSDLFSLGSTLYACAAGRPPFRASSTLAVLKKVVEEEPRPLRSMNPEVPEWLVAIIGKLMAKAPADRFQSAKEVAELLQQHLAHEQQPGTVPPPATIQVPTSAALNTDEASSETEGGGWATWLLVILLGSAVPAIYQFIVDGLSAAGTAATTTRPVWAMALLLVVALGLLALGSRHLWRRWRARPVQATRSHAVTDSERLQGEWVGVSAYYVGGAALGSQAMAVTSLAVSGNHLRLKLPGLVADCEFDVRVAGLSRKLILNRPARTDTFVVEQMLDYRLDGDLLHLTLRNPQPRVETDTWRQQGLPFPTPENQGLEIVLRRQAGAASTLDQPKVNASLGTWAAIAGGVAGLGGLFMGLAAASAEPWQWPLGIAGAGLALAGVLALAIIGIAKGGTGWKRRVELAIIGLGLLFLFILLERNGTTNFTGKILWVLHHELTVKLPDASYTAEFWPTNDPPTRKNGYTITSGRFPFDSSAMVANTAEKKVRLAPGTYWVFIKQGGKFLEQRHLTVPWGGKQEYIIADSAAAADDEKKLQGDWQAVAMRYLDGPELLPAALPLSQLEVKGRHLHLRLPKLSANANFEPREVGLRRWLQLSGHFGGNYFRTEAEIDYRFVGNRLILTIKADQPEVSMEDAQAQGIPVPVSQQRGLVIELQRVDPSADAGISRTELNQRVIDSAEAAWKQAVKRHEAGLVPRSDPLALEAIWLDLRIVQAGQRERHAEATELLRRLVAIREELHQIAKSRLQAGVGKLEDELATETALLRAHKRLRTAEAKLQPGPWQPLFDGKTLDGWRVVGDNAQGWQVKNDRLLASGEALLVSDRRFTHFQLRGEVFLKPESQFAVLFRANPSDRALREGFFHPGLLAFVAGQRDRIGQLNVKCELGIDGKPLARTEALPRADQWYSFEITAQGERLTAKVRLNGEIGLGGPDDLKAQIVEGPIILRAGGIGPIEVRKLEVRELPAAAVTSAASPAATPPAATVPATPPKLTDFETKLLAAINRERASVKASALVPEPRLIRAARAQADDMARWEDINHAREGRDPPTRLKEVGYPFAELAEVIGYNQRDPEECLKTWLETKGHREALLSPRLTQIGIGTGRDAKGNPWHAVILAAPAAARTP